MNDATILGDGADVTAQRDRELGILRRGYAIVFLVLLVGGGWAGCAPLDSAALAPGVVQVEGNRKPVQHLEGGIVTEILVAEGDSVTQNQALLVLDSARDRAERRILEGRSFNAQARVDRLIAERDDEEQITFSGMIATASATDERASDAMSNEQAIFAARLADRLGEEAVINGRRSGLEAVAQSKQQIAESLQNEISDLNELLTEGYVDKQRLRQLERSRAENLGELVDLRVSIDEAGLQVLQLKKRFKTQVVDELTQTQEQLYDLNQQLEAVVDRVTRATIRAPTAGTILNIKPNTYGAVVGSGDVLMEIVPDLKSMVVEAQVSPLDIDRVRVGQAAEVRFSVFKDAYMVTGTLLNLSADRLVNEDTGQSYYEATVKLLEQDLYLLQGMEIVPGMPAEVLIKTGERTMLSYLTSPMSRIFSRSLIED